MAKITRKIAKIFGSTPGANQIAEFGSLALGTPTFTTDPAVIQTGAFSSWLTGWFAAVVGANSPAIEDMNAFCFVMAYQAAYLMQAGVAEWETGTIYFVGSIVQSVGVLYTSLTDNNTGNAVTDVNNWVPLQKPPFNPQANTLLSGRAVSVWTQQTEATGNDWEAVAWSPELLLLVAVSFNGTHRVSTSPDGVTWTNITSAVMDSSAWTNVVWAPELKLFVAVAVSGNFVATSPNGSTWTARTPANNNDWFGLVWAAELGLLVAVSRHNASGHQVMTSPDAITWTARTEAVVTQWEAICWSPELNLFVAVSLDPSTNQVMTSPDGVNWTARNAAEVNEWASVCWSPSLGAFVAVATILVTGTHSVMYSRDGILWTPQSVPESNAWNGVTWSQELGQFVAVASSGTHRIMTSVTGQTGTWVAQTAPAALNWQTVTWAPALGIFIGMAFGGANPVMTSRYVKKIIC